MSEQPKWKFIANLGDKHPLDYGGYFVYKDTTGVYEPEAVLLQEPESEGGKYTAYRFILETCTYINGVLSDNKYHPNKAAWFAKPQGERKGRPQDSTYLSSVADYVEMSTHELINLFISADPLKRALAWLAVGEYHGFDNLDQYPEKYLRAEVKKRYRTELKNA